MIENIRKDNLAINFSNQLLNIMVLIFKNRIQKIKMIRLVLIGYSYESMMCLCKVNNFIQLLICFLMEYENISDNRYCLYSMFKYENHNIQWLFWKIDGQIILSHIFYQILLFLYIYIYIYCLVIILCSECYLELKCQKFIFFFIFEWYKNYKILHSKMSHTLQEVYCGALSILEREPRK